MSAIEFSAATSGSPRACNVAVVHQLLDVVHQTEELPLRVDLAPSSQGEPIQPLVATDVARHRLDGGKAPAVATPTLRAIDLALHSCGGCFGCARRLAPKERHLTAGGLVRISQALLAQRTVTTVGV